MTVLAFASHRSSSQRVLTNAARRAAAPHIVDRGDAPSDAAVRSALTKIVASGTFRHSQRHRAFLAYLVEATLGGRAQTLKEVVIGLEVFDRRMSGYDPDRDSIVRVEAKRLRGKLARYYADEGANDAIEIALPVGRYVPVFQPREPTRRSSDRGPTILVLPFLAFSGDLGGSATAITAGLADRIVERLDADGGLRLMAPTAGAASRGRPGDIDAFVKAHAVDYVVDGTLGAHGSRVRCVTHLSRTSDRIRRWSCRLDFDRDGADATVDWLSAQDRVADALGTAVRETLASDVLDGGGVDGDAVKGDAVEGNTGRRRSLDHR